MTFGDYILLWFTPCVLIIAFVVMLIFWSVSIYGYPKIKFKSFVSFYALNPNRWDMADDYVICKFQDGTFGTSSFSFGFIDFYRYKLWLHKQEKARKENHNMELTSRMIKAVKKDIANMELAAQHKQNESMAAFEKILNNLNGGTNK